MSEVEVYGATVWSSSGYDTGSAKVQLSLFRYSTKALNNRSSWYWLKDIASAANFCNVNNNGNANYNNASNTNNFVRPRFEIVCKGKYFRTQWRRKPNPCRKRRIR